jgi:hypothetical protein
VVKPLEELGFEVVNLCVPGWVATPTNVEVMMEKVKAVPADLATVVIYDLFGNSTFRYENYDGSVFMPLKIRGGYHLLGEVTVSTDSIFSKQVETVRPLLESVPGSGCVVVPPQPRYLFNGCCADSEHCTNVPNKDHSSKLLAATMRMRENLKKKLHSKLSKYWVADSCMACPGGTGGTDRVAADRIACLKDVCAADGVHFSVDGYRNIAVYLKNVVTDLCSGKLGKSNLSVHNTVSSAVSGTGQHFWRGISSPVGSKKPKFYSQNNKFLREKVNKGPTPYSRGRGGYGRSRRW